MTPRVLAVIGVGGLGAAIARRAGLELNSAMQQHNSGMTVLVELSQTAGRAIATAGLAGNVIGLADAKVPGNDGV